MNPVRKFFARAVILSAVLLLPHSAHSQAGAPMWVNDTWRNTNHPQSLWYVGFSQDGVRSGVSTAEALRNVEQDARNKMVESIIVNVRSGSETVTGSARVQQGAQVTEAVTRQYTQMIQASTNAVVARTETHSWLDAANNRVYAFAAVKRADLAAYYIAQVDAGFSEAQRAVALAKQAADLGRQKDANERLAEAKRQIESTTEFREMLRAVDPDNALGRAQAAAINDLLKEIIAMQMAAEEAVAVYVTGNERVLASSVSIIVPGLQTLLNDNNVRVVENRSEASHVINIEASVTNPQHDGRFHYARARVRITLVNTKTNRNEVTATFEGPKEGAMDAFRAGEQAFAKAVPEAWNRVRSRLTSN